MSESPRNPHQANTSGETDAVQWVLERRKRTVPNKLRRFINGYWLVPIFAVYLELFAILLPAWDSPLNTFYERNKNFVAGGVVLYHLVTYDFPYSFIGHAKEVVIYEKYSWQFGQIPHEDVKRAIQDPVSSKILHQRLMASQQDHESEWGGVVSLSYDAEGPHLHFYEIQSMNKTLSKDLNHLSEKPISEFVTWLEKDDNRDFLKTIGIPDSLPTRLASVLTSEKISGPQKDSLRDSFIETYRLYSESRYLLYPYDLKSFLGSGKMQGSYLGIFHFHNDLENPPSEADVLQSYNDRQIVITFDRVGIRLYDVSLGIEHSTVIPIDEPSKVVQS